MSALRLLLLLISLCLNIRAQTDNCRQGHDSIEELKSMVKNLMTDVRALRKGLAQSLKNNEWKIEWAIADGSLAPRNTSWVEEVFQKRFNGRVDFYRTWDEYAEGFGSAGGEHWMGLRNIHTLTQGRDMELYVTLTTYKGRRYAKYGRFSVSSEEDKFKLHVSNYRGNAGDSLIFHNDQKFSTKDKDNDRHAGKSCSLSHHGGWWYNRCTRSNLNGRYYAGKNNYNHQANYWYDISNRYEALKASKMMMRPVGF